jgi:P-type Cu+ transporter
VAFVDAGRAVGRLAVLRACGGIGQEPQPEHVLAHRAGHGRAWLYSIVGTVAPQLFPANLRMTDGAVAIYFEAAAVITVLVLLGQVLELRAREKTSGAIKALLGLAPKTAIKVKADGTDETVQVDAIQVNDLLRVRPGEKVPVDGELTDGKGNVDE